LYRASKFAAQHRLAGAIVGIAVPVPPGEIILRIVVMDIKINAFGAAQAALNALKNVAGILGI
jgi:hypothetical protein